jgi:thiol-disulfide isomerase/thioredoxin
MALVESEMLPLGTIAPKFKLLDTVTGNPTAFQDVKGEKGTVVIFICNHCPYVRYVNPELVRIVNDYRILGFGFVGISSNDVEKYPQDGPEEMKAHATKVGYNFPYLYDTDQQVAKDYRAACTPDFYLFDSADKLIYRGQLDDSRPGNSIPLSGRSLREAMDAVLNNHQVNALQKPSVGCSIKWKSK